jgi:predicted nuclease of predicted toxin-antitoxin system
MRFLVDAQLPPALARLLSAHGHHAEHVADIGMRDADDTAIWRHAVISQSILVTKDEDFPNRWRQGGNTPIVVWLRVGNCSRRALLVWFEPLLPQVETLIQHGEKLIEVR